MSNLEGKYLTFSLNSQLYGLPISVVREINRYADITAVPQVAKHVEGVINLRGKVIPVVNLRVRMNFDREAHTKNTCIVVIETQESFVGVIVDSVSGVIDLIADQIEKPPRAMDSATDKMLLGLGKLDDKVIILLDLATDLAQSMAATVVIDAA